MVERNRRGEEEERRDGGIEKERRNRRRKGGGDSQLQTGDIKVSPPAQMEGEEGGGASPAVRTNQQGSCQKKTNQPRQFH